jgi:AcrR family transcriptional regulator
MIHKTPDRAEPRAAQKRRRAETREQILALAEQVLADEGAEALVLHRLAATLGYRTSALYRYFESKEALVLALLERAVDAIALRVRTGMAEGDAIADRVRREVPPAERALLRIVAAARAYLDAAEAEPAHAALVARMLADPKPVVSDALSAARAVPVAMGVVADVVGCFAIARTGGFLARGNDAQRAALLWSSLEGLSTARKMARFGVGGDFEALGTGLVRALMIGFGAEAERVDECMERAFRRTNRMGGDR